MRSEFKIGASVDLGTTKVCAMIAEMGHGAPRVIGAGMVPADGLKQGVVVDIDKAAAAVDRAVREAEQMAGVSIKRCNVGAAGEHIRSMNSRGVISIPSIDEEITDDDVDRAIAASRKFSLPYDREIIHTLPTEYIVDSQRGIRQPAGMYATRLEARVHVVTASRPALDNVAKTLDLADIEVGEIVLEPLASSIAVLSAEEREMGVMLLDIGGGTTDVIVYVEGGVVASGVIGLGGNNVTSDLAYGLRTSQAHAEQIKVRYGCALPALVRGEETVVVTSVGTNEKRRLSRQFIAGIIEPRVAELFSLIDGQIRESGVRKSLGAGVVLTGGSSMLEGVSDLAEQVFELPVRIGVPRDIEGLSEIVGHPRFATGVGLLHMYSASDTSQNRSGTARRLISSFSHLKRAIASFI